MKFVIDKKKEFSPADGPRLAKEIRITLDALDLGQLLTTDGLAKAIKRSKSHLTNFITGVDMADYRYLDGRRYLYGSKKTIRALKSNAKG